MQPHSDPAPSLSAPLQELQERLKSQVEDLDFPSGAELHVRAGCECATRGATPHPHSTIGATPTLQRLLIPWQLLHKQPS